MRRKVWFKSWPLGLDVWLVLSGVLVASPSWAAPAQAAPTQAVPGFCELAALPALPVEALPLAVDSREHLTPEELLNRVAESYRGLLEFAGDEFSEARLLLLESAPLAKFFEPVPVAEQRSVALNHSLTQLGDWVLLDAEEYGLTQEMILTRLRETVRAHVERTSREQARAEETREVQRDAGTQTSTGAVFYRDTSHPKLGPGWRDPSGMIWGDTVKKADDTIRKMDHRQALRYCQSIGAELPSQEDFVRLREYMGAQPGTSVGYRAQILPDLGNAHFWTSLINPNLTCHAYVFIGKHGDFSYYPRSFHDIFWVRCVAR